MYSTPPENHEANRLTVADILSTMASVDAMTPTTLSLLDGLTGVPTRTTPTLTPTTLRNIEQTFMNLAAEQMSHDREAGFVPPLVPAPNMFNNNNNNSSSASSSSNNYTVTVTTATEQAQMENKSWLGTSSSPPRTGRRMSVGSNSSSSNSGYSSAAVSYTSSTRRGGGRRKEDRDNHDGEDTGKKLIRRERNKQAAARCRKRRLDHTMALQQETELWEEKKQTLQNEIRQLQKDKEELEQLLEAHRPQCKVPNRQNGKAVYSNQKTGQTLPAMPSLMPIPSALHQQQHHPMIKEELHDQASEESSSEDPSDRHYQQMIHQQQQRMESFTRPTVAPRQRPTTLSVASPFTTAAPPRASSTWAEIAGIAITTPSSGIPGFNFESLMEGGTGLTPVVPSPSCSTQQQRNNSSVSILPVDLSSPDASVNRKLVSL